MTQPKFSLTRSSLHGNSLQNTDQHYKILGLSRLVRFTVANYFHPSLFYSQQAMPESA